MPPYCNASLMRDYSKEEFYLMASDFKGAFACWVARQNHNEDVKVVDNALDGFNLYIADFFDNQEVPQKFNHTRLEAIINEKAFMGISAIMGLNELTPDFIDLGALSRNVLYMIFREAILEKEGLI